MSNSNDPTVQAAGHRANMCKLDAHGEFGIPFMIRAAFGDASANVSVFPLGAPFKMRVLDCVIENTETNGANANSLGICQNTGAGNPITDVMVLNNVADTSLVVPLSIDDAFATIARGGTLFLSVTKAGGTMGGVVWIKVVALEE